MKDRISLLMDGGLDDRAARQLIETLGHDREAAETWRTFHLIGDALRGTPPLAEGFTALRLPVINKAEEEQLKVLDPVQRARLEQIQLQAEGPRLCLKIEQMNTTHSDLGHRFTC